MVVHRLSELVIGMVMWDWPLYSSLHLRCLEFVVRLLRCGSKLGVGVCVRPGNSMAVRLVFKDQICVRTGFGINVIYVRNLLCS